MLQCSIRIKIYIQRIDIMDAIVMGLVFSVVVGLRFWAGKTFNEFYAELPDAEQKAMIRRAMQSGG